MSESSELYVDRGWDSVGGRGRVGIGLTLLVMGCQPYNLKPSSIPCHQVAWFTGVRHYPRLWSNWIYPRICLVVKADHRTFTKVAGPGDRTRDLPNERPRRYH